MFTAEQLLLLVCLLPIIGGLMTALMEGKKSRYMGTFFAFANLVALLSLVRAPDLYSVSIQSSWLPQWGIDLYLKVDGLSLPMLFLGPIVVLAACLLSDKVHTEEKPLFPFSFEGLVLLLWGAVQGCFLAYNLGLFYIFFEAMLLPAALIVLLWGGAGRYEATFKFVAFTLAGSLPMLLGILVLSQSVSNFNLNFENLDQIPEPLQARLLVFFLLAFLIKIPVVPFHGWLVSLYRQGPGKGIAVIAALMSKAGLIGLWRVSHQIFPKGLEEASAFLMPLLLFSVLYGAFCALGSKDMKELLAYSSMSHLGLLTMALVSSHTLALQGASLQFFAHGVAVAGWFMVLHILEVSRLSYDFGGSGGYAKILPTVGVLAMFFTLTGLGLPGLASFPAELMMLGGLAKSSYWSYMVLATLALVLAGWYLIRGFQKVFWGYYQVEEKLVEQEFSLPSGDYWALGLLALCCVVIGLCPNLILQFVTPWMSQL